MSSVVVFGSSDNTKRLCAGIVSYNQLCAEKDESNLEDIAQRVFRTETPDSVTLQIVNKYFSVDLELSLLASNVQDDFDSKLSTSEGCIIVTSHEDVVDTHAISICAAASESGLNVLMLVALRNSENSDILDELKERRILWALDNGFEYIEVDALRPTNGHQLREKEGLPRLMEALNSNMWRAMQRSDQSTVRVATSTLLTSSYVNSSSDEATAVESVFTRMSVSADTQPKNQKGVLKSTEGSQSGKESLQHTMTPTALPSASIGTDEIVSGKEDDFLSILNDKSYGSGPHGTDEKDDDMWSSFSDVISQARDMRQAALSGNMSDAERRRRAEDMAMKFCAMMDFEDDSSDEN